MDGDFDLAGFAHAKSGLDELGAFSDLGNAGLDGHCLHAISLDFLNEIFGPLPAAGCDVAYDNVGAPFAQEACDLCANSPTIAS